VRRLLNHVTFPAPAGARLVPVLVGRVGHDAVVAREDDVLLTARVVGPSLTVAGLAAWILAHAGREQDARECDEIQELIDTSLRERQTDVRVPRTVVMRAAELWEAAAEVAETWASEGDRPARAAEWRRQAERLRIRAESLRKLL
jgi:hypothetical protein